MLIRLVISLRGRTNSVKVVMWAAHCAVLTTSSPTRLVAFNIAPVLPIILDISRSSSLAQLAFWFYISMVCVHFHNVLILLTSDAFPIISTAVYSLFASPITLDKSGLSCSPIQPSG